MGLDPTTQFEEVYLAHYNHVRNYLLIMSPSEAEDLTQETFLRAYQAKDRFVQVMPVEHWLLRIAHNTAISFLRKSARQEQPLELAEDYGYTADYTRVDNRDLLRLMSRKLSKKQRLLLQLKFGEGLTNRRIAKELGISENTVGSAVYNARHRMVRVAI